MTSHQQDKHTCKVDSSFLSPWIRNLRKQVQEAGGNSGEQDAAMPCLYCSTAPQGCGWKKWGALQVTRGSSLICSRSTEKGSGVECLQAVFPEALSIKTSKRQFPWQWLRVVSGATSLVVCVESQDARTMREPIFRDLGRTVWPWRERTNCVSDMLGVLGQKNISCLWLCLAPRFNNK